MYFLLNLYLTFNLNCRKNCEARISLIFIRIVEIMKIINDYFIILIITE